MLTAAIAAVVPVSAAFAAPITRNTAAVPLNTNGAWIGDVAPTAADVAVWNSSSVGGGQDLGGSVAWSGILVSSGTPTAGPAFTNALNTTARTITLGAAGIELSGTTTNRGVSFESNVGVVLGEAQTWAMGNGGTAANIVASSVISGPGALSITRAATATSSLQLAGANTFSGGLTAGANSRILVGAVSTTNGTAVLSGPLGTGAVTFNGPMTLATSGGGNRDIAVSTLNLAGDITVGEAATNTGRVRLTGAIDLGGATRTVTIANSQPLSSASFGFNAVNGLNATIGNGTLSIQRAPALATPVAVGFVGGNVASFLNNAGLIIGPGVTTNIGSSFVFGNNASDRIPNLTVQSGGTFDLSNHGANAFNTSIAALSGAGMVTSSSTTAGGTSQLSINGSSATALNGDFSGSINNGANVTLSVVKSGATRQTLSGVNGYTGVTTVNNGTLRINGVLSAGAAAVTVNGGTLDGTGDGVSTGLIARDVVVGNGTLGTGDVRDAFIAPGNDGIGSLRVASLGFATDGRLRIELSSVAAGSADLLRVTGALNLANSSIDFATLTPSLDDPAYVFATFGSLSGTFAEVLNLPSLYELDYNFGGQNQIALVLIPEPGSVTALLAFGGLLASRRCRRLGGRQ
jgi:autotransporter-associated beta strand protein